MNMRFDAADPVETNPRRFKNPMSQIVIKPVLDARRYHRQIVFGMPSNVKIDLRIYGVGHGAYRVGKGMTLKRPRHLFCQFTHAVNDVAILPCGKASPCEAKERPSIF